MTIDIKVQKVTVEIDLQDTYETLNEKVNILKQYICLQREQYNEIKANLKINEVLLHVEFGENYDNKQPSGI